MSNVTVVIQYLFACLAVPVLRKKLGPLSVRQEVTASPPGRVRPAV